MVIQTLGSKSISLKEAHEFDWLSELGDIFAVFDQQDSGNVSFGVADGDKKWFVKYAGAKTLYYEGGIQQAVERIKEAVAVYEHLAHPNLVTLHNHFATNGGYALVFPWAEGECLHAHWLFPPPAKYTDPNSPTYKHKRLPVAKRLDTLDRIYSFHEHVERNGYVAIDFYDGSILYDFSTGVTTICDIDLYRKKPYVNTMGRMWGSKRFMAPEEFQLGAAIDAQTNVYTMGAVAFALLGNENKWTEENWDASNALFEVAKQATAAEREARFPTVAAFVAAWQEAKKR
ncbi:serine/threonine protein kinase [Bacillus sp. FSL W7-1321]